MYIIIEMQTEAGSTAICPVEAYPGKDVAESAYHTKLAAAALSSVDVHTVVLLDEHGNTLRAEYYEHPDVE